MKIFKKVSNSLNHLSDERQGIAFVILACFFASILIALVRHLSAEFHIFFIVMVRNFFGLLFFMPQIVNNHRDILRTKRIGMHIWRSLNGLFSMTSWFYVITLIPMSEAVAISFIIPILTMVAAVIFLKEKVKSHLWIAVFIGFIGVLIILRPGFKEFNVAYFYSFFSIVAWCISNLLIKVMTRTEKPQTIVIYMSFIMMMVSIPFAMPYMQPINFENFCYFAALGLVSNLVHIFVSNAYAKSELSVVQPFDFSRLVFTSIIAYFFFNEVIDIWVIIGSLVIFVGVILAIPRRKKIILTTPVPEV
jgi:drug/metabolite transporter (DMT)-like permease